VVQHPRGRSDHARRVDDRFPFVGHADDNAIVFCAAVVAIAVVADRAEHGRLRAVRGCGHGGQAARHGAAHRADERAVQAGREQHVVPARIGGRVQAERVQLLLFVLHFWVAGAHLAAGLHEHPVRQPHHVRLVKRRDPEVAVVNGVFERHLGHGQRVFPRHRLDGLHDACMMIYDIILLYRDTIAVPYNTIHAVTAVTIVIE